MQSALLPVMSAIEHHEYSPTPLTKYFSDEAVTEELAKTLLVIILCIVHDNEFYARREFDFLCNVLHY